jgi:hypothetical protein
MVSFKQLFAIEFVQYNYQLLIKFFIYNVVREYSETFVSEKA